MFKESMWYDSSWIRTYILFDSGWLIQFGLLTWVLLVLCLAAIIPGIIGKLKQVLAVERLPGPPAWPIIGNALIFNVPPRGNERLPGPPAWPIIGNALIFNVPPRELFSTMMSICCYEEGITRVWMAIYPNVFIYKADVVEIVLSSMKHIEKGEGYEFIHPWLGLGLLTSTGEKWKSRRKMLTPTFHFKILEDFVEVFNRQSLKLVDKLEKETKGKPADIFPYISRCALDIICETAMGVNLNSQEETESKYLLSVAKMNALVQHRSFRPWLYSNFLYRKLGPYQEFDQTLKVLHGFTKDAIKKRKLERNKMDNNMKELKSVGVKRKRLAFLDMLLEYSESGYQLSDEDIREEVDTFMFEGHDTTTAALNFTLYLLGLHPDIQEKVHGELDEVFGDSNRVVTSDDLGKLKYLECCIKESLRLFPSVPIHSRKINENLQLGKHTVPAGVQLHVNMFKLHRDPTHFPEPETFLPERFTPENSSGRHPYAYIPFSAGPRNCIGQKFAMMEEKIVLSNILRNFQIESQVPREELYIIGELILKPENGNILKLSSRNGMKCPEE